MVSFPGFLLRLIYPRPGYEGVSKPECQRGGQKQTKKQQKPAPPPANIKRPSKKENFEKKHSSIQPPQKKLAPCHAHLHQQRSEGGLQQSTLTRMWEGPPFHLPHYQWKPQKSMNFHSSR